MDATLCSAAGKVNARFFGTIARIMGFVGFKHASEQLIFKITPVLPRTREYGLTNSFCTESYRNWHILAPDKEFSTSPDAYFRNRAGALGVFENSPLPISEVFDFTPPENSLECGRFATLRNLPRMHKIILARQLIFATAQYYRPQILLGQKFYIETHRLCYDIITEAMEEYDRNFLMPVKAKVIPERIPPKSKYFYEKMDPRVYLINTDIFY